MKNITKDKLISIGFEEEYQLDGDNHNEIEYYYYTYNINGECLLISDASDENDGNFTIEIFEFDSIKITNFDELIKFIDIIKRNIYNER